MLAGVAEWQTRTFKGRVGDRVGSSPTTSTKRPSGLFFVGGTFALCATNALHLEPTACGWRPSSQARQRSLSCYLTSIKQMILRKFSPCFFVR